MKEIDEALVATAGFLDNLMAEEKKVMGSEGMNAGYTRLMDAMCRCFEWGRLVSTPPSRDDVVAFLEVCDLLRPYLKRSEWPSSTEFPSVTRGWPSRDALAQQYLVLLRRIREVPFRNPVVCKDWWEIRGYRVAPVAYYSSVLWFVRGLHSTWVRKAGLGPTGLGPTGLGPTGRGPTFVTADSLVMLKVIASVISACMGCGFNCWGGSEPDEPPLPSRVGHVYTIARQGLARQGVPWKGRKRPQQLRRNVKEDFAYRPAPAGLGVLMLPGSAGKLVRVIEVVQDLDWSAVSASLDGNRFFSRDARIGGRPRSLWHVLKIHNHCRPIGAAEACCERTGSFMHSVWRENLRISTEFLMDTVLLREAGVKCVGSRRDAVLCEHVANAMLQIHPHPTVCFKRGKRQRLADGIQHSRSIHFLREDGDRALVVDGRWPKEDRPLGDGMSDVEGDGPLDLASEARAPLAQFGTSAAISASMRTAQAMNSPAMQLPARVAQTLRNATTPSGGVRALPKVDLNVRTERKGLAQSSMREREFVWMRSAEGVAWLSARQQAMRRISEEGEEEEHQM